MRSNVVDKSNETEDITVKRAQIFAVALLAAFSLASSLLADEVINLQFVSAGDNPMGGYYVSPYTARVMEWNNTLISLYCNDFNNGIHPPNDWTAHVSTVDATDLADAQYGTLSNRLELYSRSAWLFTQSVLGGSHYWEGVYQYAAWGLFVDTAHSTGWQNAVNSVGGSFSTDVTNASGNSLAEWNSGAIDASGWRVITPYPQTKYPHIQEFLIPVPEPSTLLLLATGAVGMFLFRRRKSTRT